MPTPEARAAYSDAQHLLERLRRVHTREIDLLNKSHEATTDEGRAVLAEIDRVRTEWTDLFKEYSDAIARYTVAVEKSRAAFKSDRMP
jgi:hypothetical protein